MAGGGSVNAQKLAQVSARLGDTVLDPALWPEVMEELCAGVDACGAVLLQPDFDAADARAVAQKAPQTASLALGMERYYRDGWFLHDTRAAGCMALLSGGRLIFSDRDLVKGNYLTEDMLRHDAFLNEFEFSFGFKWSSFIGFMAGSAPWIMAIKHWSKSAPLDTSDATDNRALMSLGGKLGEAATLSNIVGRRVLAGISDALTLIDQAAVILGRGGIVLASNAAANALFDDDLRISNRRLAVRDGAADVALQNAVERIGAGFDMSPFQPLPVRRQPPKRPLIARVFPIPVSARGPFLGGCTLVLLSDPDGAVRPAPAAILTQVFGLTGAEGRLASLIAQGMSAEDAANTLGLARDTVRNQIKAIYAKTGTHRQSELVALLARL